MDGGVPAFDVRRWHRQFAVAQLQDVLRDLQNPEPGPEEVWASLYGQARGNVAGDPTGLEAVFGGGERRTPRRDGRPASSAKSWNILEFLEATTTFKINCDCHNGDLPEVGARDGKGTDLNDIVVKTCEGGAYVLEKGMCVCRYKVIDSYLTCKACGDPVGDGFCCDTGGCAGKYTSSDFQQWAYVDGKCVGVYTCQGEFGCAGCLMKDHVTCAPGAEVVSERTEELPPCWEGKEAWEAAADTAEEAAGTGLQEWWENGGADWVIGAVAGSKRWKSDQSDDPCTADFIRCTESFPPTPGVRYKHDLCTECLKLCQGQGYWPTHTKDGRSCIQGVTPFGAGR